MCVRVRMSVCVHGCMCNALCLIARVYVSVCVHVGTHPFSHEASYVVIKIYCILCGWIKGFNSPITTIIFYCVKLQLVASCRTL